MVNGEPKPSRRHQWDDTRGQLSDSKRRRFNAQFSLKTNVPPDLSPKLRLDGSQSRGSMFPSRPYHNVKAYHNVKEYSPQDPSLKLPPLQTTTAKVATPVIPFSQQSGSSRESIVMAIPVLNKINLLAKISPPLTPPLRDDSSSLQRGPVISVDGQDPVLVETVSEYLHSVLEGKYNVQTFKGPQIDSRKPSSESWQMGNAIADYLQTIAAWHPISDGIRRFVRPSTGFLVPKPTKKDAHSGISSKAITPEITNLLRSPTQSSVNIPVKSQMTSVSDHANPLALVLRYQLTSRRCICLLCTNP